MANMYEPDADFLCNPLSVEYDSSIQLSLLPNPAESYITINNINSEFVELYSFSGVLLLRIDTKYKTDTNLDISKYPSGVYFIKTQNTMSKFIKIK